MADYRVSVLQFSATPLIWQMHGGQVCPHRNSVLLERTRTETVKRSINGGGLNVRNLCPRYNHSAVTGTPRPHFIYFILLEFSSLSCVSPGNLTASTLRA